MSLKSLHISMPCKMLVFILAAFLYLGSVHGVLYPLAVRLPLGGEEAAPGAPWPLPQIWFKNSALKTIDPNNFLFTSNMADADVIEAAFGRYGKIINLDSDGRPDALDVLEQLDVTVSDTSYQNGQYPNTDMDESYVLTIDDSSIARLEAGSVWGALRGLETFSQLIYLTEDKLYQLNETFVVDFPRFQYRGMMMDTSRHFIPMSTILDNLDALSYNKFNVFHWHVTDDQSFPYPSRTFPNLTEFGAYHPDLVYSRDDVTTILEQARLRGIRVIPEFDTPGHTWSWGLALPDLITPCWGAGPEGGPGVPNFPEHGPREIVNPMEEYTYDVLDQLYDEIIEDFPDEYVHLGMDEVYYACWESSPVIAEWMSQMGFTETNQVEQYYSNRLIDIVRNKGTKYIIWEDPINNNVEVDPDTLVEVWKDTRNDPNQFRPWQEYLLNVTSKGYQALLSAPWYLNVIEYGADWVGFYQVEPTSFTEDESQQALLRGGETTMWMELADGTFVLSRIWPRASAVAEKLWSAKDADRAINAQYRLDQQRCRMVRRGIPAAPIMNGYCGDYEWNL